MKKLLPLLFVVSSATMAWADPTPPTAADVPDPTAPVLPQLPGGKAGAAAAALVAKNADPEAMLLLNQTMQAYSQLKGATMFFTTYDQTNAMGLTKVEMCSGTVSFSLPSKARLEMKQGGKNLLIISDGTTLYEQSRPDEYQEYKMVPGQAALAIPQVLMRIPSALGIFAAPLAGGDWISAQKKIMSQKASLLPDNGINLMAKSGNGPTPPIAFRLYFDPTDHLLRRAEARLDGKGQDKLNLTTLTSVQNNPEFPDDMFTFTPAPGARRVAPTAPPAGAKMPLPNLGALMPPGLPPGLQKSLQSK